MEARTQSWLVGAAVAFLLCVPLAGHAVAHTLSTSYAAFTVSGSTVSYLGTMAAHDLLGPMPQLDRNRDEALDRTELETGRGAVVEYLRARIVVRDGDTVCPAQGAPSLEMPPGTRELHARLTFTCATPPVAPVVRAMLFDEPGSEHRVSVSVALATGEVRAAMLDAAAPVFDPAAGGLGAQLLRFLVEGILHFASGTDHILFLAAVLVAADRFGRLALIVTSFTIGHSLTLVLATLEVVALPSVWVESAIALSIAYVALENVAMEELKHRWAITLGFGLIHGFGFASVLRETGLPTRALVPSLLMFNVGVEVGQLAAVCALYPLLLLARKSERRDSIIAIGSAAIGSCGVYWFVERAFG